MYTCFFETGDGHIKRVLEDFKRWTATQANKLLNGEGRFWQIEWFDPWSRSDEESEKIVRYIRRNPLAAGLIEDGEAWPYVGHFRRKCPGQTHATITESRMPLDRVCKSVVRRSASQSHFRRK
ncbi:MAG: hypothetical protein CMJ64_18195 [Planctomycetaceae bacterium]|nr:hypothetical protein [Planctomycetaceae bacterium]